MITKTQCIKTCPWGRQQFFSRAQKALIIKENKSNKFKQRHLRENRRRPLEEGEER